MHKVNFLKGLAVVYFLVFSFQMVLFGLIEDYLLFKSDLQNFLLYCLGMSFILAVPLFCGFMFSFFFLPNSLSEKIHRQLIYMSGAGVLTAFVIFSLDFLIYKIQSVLYFFLFALLLFISFFFFVKKIPLQSKFIPTMQQVSNTVFALAIVMMMVLYGHNAMFLNHSANVAENKNVILLVLDGLGSQFLSPYHWEASTPEFEEISKTSRLYTNIRTNFTYTMGFFWALYTGKKNMTDPKENLLTLMQKNGINTRWTAMHNGAVPDATQIPYKGLRSAFITQNFTWVPELLNLDYNVFRHNQGLRGIPMGNREQAVYHLTNKFFPRKNILETHIIKEIENLRQENKPFFLLVHTNRYGDSLIPRGEKEMLEIWDSREEGTNENPDNDEKFRAKFNDQDYVYGMEDSWIVDLWREKHKRRLKEGLKSLKRFYDTYIEKGWDQDTMLIITSDHGYILNKGKVWYGYHNEEEVTRVPMIIHFRDLKGTDERLGETIDISQTVLEFFGIEKKLSRNAMSLISPHQKEYTTTLTNPSKIRKEYFLIIYTQRDKYILNLHPGQMVPPIKAIIENRFDTIPKEKGFDATKDLSPKIRKEIKEDFVDPLKKGNSLLWQPPL